MSAVAAVSGLREVAEAEARLLLPTYERLPVLFERGEGVYLYDADGKRYLDLLTGIGVNALGYAHPAVQKVLHAQADKLIHISNLFFHPYQAELAEKLTKWSGLDRAFFCNSGTEAWEGALKLARAYAQYKAKGKKKKKPKWRFLALDYSFHGRTFGSVAMTATKKYREPFTPLMPGVRFVKFDDVKDLKKKFDDTVCAIGLEPVQGEGGIRPVSREFMAAAREIATKKGALLLADEIQCGLGRTGKFFAFQHFGIKPDVVTLAKPIANGLPLGAILTTNEVASAIKPGMHGTTFGGGPLATAVGCTVVDAIDDKMLAHIREVGAYFRAALEQLQAEFKFIKQVRGMGLMLAMELDNADRAKAVVRGMLEKGVIINRTHDTVLRLLPPFILENHHVDHAIATFREVLGAVATTKGNKQ